MGVGEGRPSVALGLGGVAGVGELAPSVGLGVGMPLGEDNGAFVHPRRAAPTRAAARSLITTVAWSITG
jgi:hypothetical protein